jgi:hypothetical protein
MSEPYRNDHDALSLRITGLEAEIAALRATLADRVGIEARANALEADLDDLRRRRAAGDAPFKLEDVRIATPCKAKWEDMVGDDRSRFCVSCQKHVYDLRAMTRAEAEGLLGGNGETCIKMARRADGTVITSDCPVGVQQVRRRRAAYAVAGAGLLAVSALLLKNRVLAEPDTVGQLQALPNVDLKEVAPTPALMGTAAPTVMGSIAAPYEAPPTAGPARAPR